MAKIEFKGLKDKLQGTLDNAKKAVKEVDLTSVKEKLQETGAAAKETANKLKENVASKAEEIKANREKKKSEQHTIVQLKGSDIRILLPDGYEKLKHKNPLKGLTLSLTNEFAGYGKVVSTSANTVMIAKSVANEVMNSDDPSGLISWIHEHLADDEGLIEVKNGVTKRGYKYIYSIIKNLMQDVHGVRYFLRLDLIKGEDIVEIQAEFKEINMTGGREAMCLNLAQMAGLVEFSEGGLKGWMQDPYDPEYTKGITKNLAEKEGIDGLFPDNPLTQAHELLMAVLNDEFVIARKEDNDEEKTSDVAEENLSDEEKEEKKRESIRQLFVDECQRYTYPVEVDKPEDVNVESKETVSEAVENARIELGKKKKEDEPLTIRAISTRNAIKIIYYLMAADGEIYHSEEEKFDSIGKELDPKFFENKESIVKECELQLKKVIDPEDYYDVLQDGVEDALLSSKQTADTFITPKLLVWDLLTIAYSDESYDEAERKLLKYIVRKTNIDKSVFLEMESSILTLMDIEKEISWIKTTNRPYLTIEAMVNELADRKNVIFESVKDLIAL